MPAAAIIPIVTAIGGAYITSKIASDAAKDANAANMAATREGIAEQRRQFDVMRELSQPYISAGQSALGQQQSLLGFHGEEVRQGAVDELITPEVEALMLQGEEAMRQSASATGGLRGGNFQGALAEYRPRFTQNLINDRMTQLGGMAGMGQASATGQAVAAGNMGANVSGMITEQGRNRADMIIAQGQNRVDMWGEFIRQVPAIEDLF